MVDKKSSEEEAEEILEKMASTSERKLEIELKHKEIERIDAEIDSLRKNRWIEFIKIGIMVVGGIILFFAIQQPDSFAGRRSSDEAIARERAQLILELLKEQDPEKIALGLDVIKSAYPGSNEKWIRDIEETYTEKANLKQIMEYKERFHDHFEDRDDLIASYTREISRKRMDSVKVARIRKNIEQLDKELDGINKNLDRLGANRVLFEPFLP